MNDTSQMSKALARKLVKDAGSMERKEIKALQTERL